MNGQSICCIRGQQRSKHCFTAIGSKPRGSFHDSAAALSLKDALVFYLASVSSQHLPLPLSFTEHKSADHCPVSLNQEFVVRNNR